jgi:hypothetical protein
VNNNEKNILISNEQEKWRKNAAIQAMGKKLKAL